MTEYKIQQLQAMLAAETADNTGGYGAHLQHWANGKAIQLDADAIRALIAHYEKQQGAAPTR